MNKKKKPGKPEELPRPEKTPETPPATNPEYPGLPDETPHTFPGEEPSQPGPEELPPPHDFWEQDALVSIFWQNNVIK